MQTIRLGSTTKRSIPSRNSSRSSSSRCVARPHATWSEYPTSLTRRFRSDERPKFSHEHFLNFIQVHVIFRVHNHLELSRVFISPSSAPTPSSIAESSRLVPAGSNLCWCITVQYKMVPTPAEITVVLPSLSAGCSQDNFVPWSQDKRRRPFHPSLFETSDITRDHCSVHCFFTAFRRVCVIEPEEKQRMTTLLPVGSCPNCSRLYEGRTRCIDAFLATQ
jgi:hypothetical protein